MKKILKYVKRFIISAFVLYGYNLIAVPLNMIIPINFVTLVFVTIFGLPAVFSLITILVLVY